MSGPLRDIDNLFFNGIGEHAEYPSEKIWDNIEAGLDKKAADIYKRKYKMLKRSVAVLLFLLASVLIYEARGFLNGKGQQPEGAITKNSVRNKSDQDVTSKEQDHAPYIKEGENKISNSAVTGIEQGDINAYGVTNDKERYSVVKDGTATADFIVISAAVSGSDENADASSSIFSNDLADGQNDFSPTYVDDYWKRGIMNSSTGIVINSKQPSFSPQTINMSPKTNRLSLLLSVSPNLAWKSIEDSKPHRRGGRGSGNNGPRGPGNGGGNNGGGSNGGGNGGGGNNGQGNGSGGRPRGENRHDFKQTEENNIAYSGAAQLGYQLTKRLSLKTGLSYLVSSTDISSKKAYAIKDNQGKVSYRVNCSSGYSYLLPKGATTPRAGDSTVVTNSKNTASYIGIPLSVEYKVLSLGRFSLSASAGGQLNLLVKAKTTAQFDAASTGKSTASNHTEGLKKAYFSALAAVTAEIRITKKVSLTLAPETQFGLTYINTQTWVKTRTNYMGLSAGLKLKL